MYSRTLTETLKSKKGRGKAIILIGPRQVGETTLLKNQLLDKNHLFLDADDPIVRNILNNPNTEQFKSIVGNSKVVFIDEAQRIPGIGITLKILIDQFKKVQLYVSSSSSFDLSNELNEPLTGRKWEYELFPISWEEYEERHGYLFSEQQLENRLLYGFYPDVLNNSGEEQDILKQLVNSYLYRDILAYSKIRKPEVLEKLVQSLALQLGSEVNSYSGNLRNEIKKNKKIYFYDNGVRNMILGNFSSLNLRQDTGSLWENFLISERVKQNIYKGSLAKMYFWRTKQQQEVDLVEDLGGQLTGFEFKWNAKQKVRLPKTFIETYKAEQKIIDRNNFREFVVL